MSINICFTPIKAEFQPFPQFTISTQWLAKKFSHLFDGEKVSPETASVVVASLRIPTLVSSYLLSPNILIPLQILEVLHFASSSSTSSIDKVTNVIFSTAVLGLICKYTHDGTLQKFSNDLYSFSNEAQKVLVRLDNNHVNEVTFYEPPQIPDNPEQIGCVRSIISFINSIFRKIFEFFFSIKDWLSSMVSSSK